MRKPTASTADPLAKLAVQVAADHAANKAAGGLSADADLAGEGPDPVPEPEKGEQPEPETGDDEERLGDGVNTSAIEAAAERAELLAGSLVGDIRDTMMDVFKHRPKPWSQMLAGEQQDVATAIEYAVKVTVRKAVLALAAEDRPSIRAIFKGFGVKGGEVAGNLKFLDLDDLDRMALFHAESKEVLLVVADAQSNLGERRAVQIDAEQSELGFDAGDDEEREEPE